MTHWYRLEIHEGLWSHINLCMYVCMLACMRSARSVSRIFDVRDQSLAFPPKYVRDKLCFSLRQELPEALPDNQLPKGWQATGRKKDVYKCNRCNVICVKMSKAGLKLSALEGLGPLELKEFFVSAREKGGKKLKEDFLASELYIYIYVCVYIYMYMVGTSKVNLWAPCKGAVKIRRIYTWPYKDK